VTWIFPATLLASLACREQDARGLRADAARSVEQHALHTLTDAPTPRDLVLAPREGDHPLEQRIRVLQQRCRERQDPARDLERLGWTFVAIARELGDPGDHQLALQAALAMDAHARDTPAALLLRGHALHGLHRFTEAEQVARELVAVRGLPFDHGLLGDVLVDRGALDEATVAYQRMLDERPDMHAYARAAHVRFLRGDRAGAVEAMQLAVKAASPRNAESFAWVWSKLALYALATGARESAHHAAQRALQRVPSWEPALRVEALLAIDAGAPARAVELLARTRADARHPETVWLLRDALRLLGRAPEADALHAQLVAPGASEDPRTLALYLVSHREQLARADALIRRELHERQDIYTFEVLAQLESARGRHAEALDAARRSLAAGTEDARLFYHAGLVAEQAGDRVHARSWLDRARAGALTLLPSQRAQLAARLPTP